jgi:hypothetical protein
MTRAVSMLMCLLLWTSFALQTGEGGAWAVPQKTVKLAPKPTTKAPITVAPVAKTPVAGPQQPQHPGIPQGASATPPGYYPYYGQPYGGPQPTQSPSANGWPQPPYAAPNTGYTSPQPYYPYPAQPVMPPPTYPPGNAMPYGWPPNGGVHNPQQPYSGQYYSGQPNGQPSYAGQPPYPLQQPPSGGAMQDPYAPAAQLPNTVALPNTQAPTVLLILDASYSMGERLDEGQTKMAVAKRAILDTLARLPASTIIGLRVYGLSANPLTACSASRFVVPFGVNNRAVIANYLLGLRPTGETPISFSLREALQSDFAGRQGPKAVILVTDGMETCDADPCRVAVQLVRNGSQVKIHTIALGLARDYDALRQLKCISAATYGRFYSANTYAELAKGLANSIEVRTSVGAQIIQKPKP